jgi:hypothetical protein
MESGVFLEKLSQSGKNTEVKKAIKYNTYSK